MTFEIASQYTSYEVYKVNVNNRWHPGYQGQDDHQWLEFTSSKFIREAGWDYSISEDRIIRIIKDCFMKESYNPMTLLEFEGRRSCQPIVKDHMIKGDSIKEVIQIKVQHFFDFYQKEYPLLCFKFKVVQVNSYSEDFIAMGRIFNPKTKLASPHHVYRIEGTVSLRIENCLTFIDHKKLENVADLHFKFRQKSIDS